MGWKRARSTARTRRAGLHLRQVFRDGAYRTPRFELLEPRKMLASFVLPHLLEVTGRTTDTENTFDTTIYATYSDGLPGGRGAEAPGATLEIYIFDETTDLPATSADGRVVCAPCTVELDPQTPRVELNVEEAFAQKGGFPGALQGFMMIEVTGDADNVAMNAVLLNSHSGPLDLEGTPLPVVPLIGTPPGETRSFVTPDIKESEDGVFNDLLFATYVAGLPNAPPGSFGEFGATGADVDLYLYDRGGAPMVSSRGLEIANPATFHLDTTGRKVNVFVENLFQAAGGFPHPLAEGYAIVNVRGDAGNVVLDHI